MKEKILFAFIACIALLGVGLVNAAEVENSVLITTVYPTVMSISVPNEILLPNMAAGYNSGDVGFDVINVGTQDISISAEVEPTYTGDIYANLFFKENLVDNVSSIDTFNFDLMKPTLVGGNRTEKIFVSLDLTNYDTSLITEQLVNHTAEVVFTAVPTFP